MILQYWGMWFYNLSYYYRVWETAMTCVKYLVDLMYGPNTCTVDDQLHTGAVTFVQMMKDSFDIPAESYSPTVYDQCSKYGKWRTLSAATISVILHLFFFISYIESKSVINLSLIQLFISR